MCLLGSQRVIEPEGTCKKTMPFSALSCVHRPATNCELFNALIHWLTGVGTGLGVERLVGSLRCIYPKLPLHMGRMGPREGQGLVSEAGCTSMFQSLRLVLLSSSLVVSAKVFFSNITFCWKRRCNSYAFSSPVMSPCLNQF